jgi:multiple sugar transport system substrate-binding protein
MADSPMKTTVQTVLALKAGGLARSCARRLGGVVLAMLLGLPAPALAQTTLKLFIGGLLRPDLFRQIGEAYALANPGITVEIETGGATPDLQQRALAQAVATRDATLDLVLIDVLRPPQWTAGQVIEPLDAYLGAERDAIVARYLPPYRAVMSVGGKVMALPISADIQMLFFRSDLLDKYGLAVPKTWEELKAAAQKVLEGEKSPALRGFGMSGALVETTVCTYLAALWGMGEEIPASGVIEVERARKPFQLWSELRLARVLAPNPAETATDRVRQEMQAGTLLFASTWAYAFSRLQGDAASPVRDRIGLAGMPGPQAGCLGGWLVAVTAFSRNKPEAVKFARYLSSPETAAMLAVQAGWMPVFEALYADEAVLKAQPWLKQALPMLRAGRLRPATARYGEVSEIIRTNVNAFLAGSRNADAAATDISRRLGAVLR